MGRTETLKEVLGDVVALNHVKPKYANGVRTALAVGVPLAAAVLFDRHGYHALFPVVGALFVAVNDPGGRYSDRAISVIGAAILFTFSVFVGSVTGDNLWLSAPMLFVWAFVGGYALGISGAPMGIRAAVLFAVASSRASLPIEEALNAAGLVAAGCVWASFLSLVLWPIRPFLAVRAAVSALYRHVGETARLSSRAIEGGFPEEVVARVDEQRRSLRVLLTAAVNATTVRRTNIAVNAPFNQALLLLTLHAERLAVVDIALSENARTSRLDDAQRDRLVAVYVAVADGCEHLADALETRGGGPWQRVLDEMLATVRDRVLELQKRCSRETRTISLSIQAQAMLDVLSMSAGDLTGSRTERTSLDATTSIRHPFHAAPGSLWNKVRGNASLDSFALRTGLRVGVVGAAVVVLHELTGWREGLWVTVTVLILMKPEMGDTFVRGGQLLVGTLIGAVLAAALVVLLADDPVALLAASIVLAFAMASFLPINYFVWAVCVTPFVILMRGLDEPGDWHLAVLRAGNATLGAFIALASTLLLWPNRRRREVAPLLTTLLLAIRDYAAAALNMEPALKLRGLRQAAWRADTNLQLGLQHLAHEPGSRGPNDEWFKLAALASRVLHAATSLSILCHHGNAIAFRNAYRLGPSVLSGLTEVTRSVAHGMPPSTTVRAALERFETEFPGPPETFVEAKLAEMARDVLAMQRLVGSPTEPSLETLVSSPVASPAAGAAPEPSR